MQKTSSKMPFKISHYITIVTTNNPIMVRDFYSYKNFCSLLPPKFIKLNKEAFDMFDDAKLEKLENLYNEYDSATTKSEKRRALNEILEINPTDIDSMHRLVDLLPEKQQLDALLKLKQDAWQIIKDNFDDVEDLYYYHGTRPYMFILLDILKRYERNKNVEEAYQIIKEMMELNESDNLGERFHLVAYYIGQNKINELRDFVKKCPENSSVALRFAILYLDNFAKEDKEFKSLYDEFPYLYALIGKELYFKKYQFQKIKGWINYYRPNGFFECFLFYEMLSAYCNTVTMSLLQHKCAYYKDMPRISITECLPRNTKSYLFALAETYDDSYKTFLEKLKDFNIEEKEFLKDYEKLEKMQILEKREDKIYFNEASYALLIYYVKKEEWTLDYIKRVTGI